VAFDYMKRVDTRSTGVGFGLGIQAFGMGTLVVSAYGDVDLVTAAELETELLETVDGGARRVVVDLTEATFFDSSAVHALVRVGERLQSGGRQLAVVCGNPVVNRVLDITGVDRVLPIHATIEQAMSLPVSGSPWRQPGPVTFNRVAADSNA